jgi:hypothetical protein
MPGFPHPKWTVAPIPNRSGTDQAGPMFQPVFHYLLEAVRICAQVVNLSTSALATLLFGIAALFTAILMLGARVQR